MKPTDPIKSMQMAAYRYAYDDGIVEILIAVLLAAGAAMMMRFAGIVLWMAIGLTWVLPRLRDRITTPRAGYAVLPQRLVRDLLGVALFGLVAGAVVASLRWLTQDHGAPLGEYRWIPLFAGLLLSGGFLYVFQTARLKRFLLYLAVSIGGGLWFALTPETGIRQAAYASLRQLVWVLSAVVACGGLISLMLFLRRNPVRTGDEVQGAHNGR